MRLSQSAQATCSWIMIIAYDAFCSDSFAVFVCVRMFFFLFFFLHNLFHCIETVAHMNSAIQRTKTVQLIQLFRRNFALPFSLCVLLWRVCFCCCCFHEI